jgi:hypothetical protein
MLRHFLLLLAIVWASPWSLIGVCAGLLGVATGGRVQRTGKVLEFYGGVLGWTLAKAPIVGGASAMTLGHVVLGRTFGDIEFTRDHEAVHVAQYERWGIFFIPAYFGCSLWLWFQGRNPYFDNPFEREAYKLTGDAARRG